MLLAWPICHRQRTCYLSASAMDVNTVLQRNSVYATPSYRRRAKLVRLTRRMIVEVLVFGKHLLLKYVVQTIICAVKT